MILRSKRLSEVSGGDIRNVFAPSEGLQVTPVFICGPFNHLLSPFDTQPPALQL